MLLREAKNQLCSLIVTDIFARSVPSGGKHGVVYASPTQAPVMIKVPQNHHHIIGTMDGTCPVGIVRKLINPRASTMMYLHLPPLYRQKPPCLWCWAMRPAPSKRSSETPIRCSLRAALAPLTRFSRREDFRGHLCALHRWLTLTCLGQSWGEHR